ncbi:hypothetical protein SD961_05620 [Erwinia sp. MMLR14_017]|uniref:hypothetical protein n=1 Tax=Erwinia sp. MMLR14_017 TaxID=3093842 RepID=UPI00298FCF4D|nr:hypothetical protein [Erwinia sp. MMLR14_017]MDW8845379.1 hypothetical protein [Erwinia sp. MMLR14_017]
MILPSPDTLNREYLIKIIEFYGFIECSCILAFLQTVCSKNLDAASYRFIHEKLKECLHNHYSDSCKHYFDELKKLQTEIEYILSVFF